MAMVSGYNMIDLVDVYKPSTTANEKNKELWELLWNGKPNYVKSKSLSVFYGYCITRYDGSKKNNGHVVLMMMGLMTKFDNDVGVQIDAPAHVMYTVYPDGRILTTAKEIQI